MKLPKEYKTKFCPKFSFTGQKRIEEIAGQECERARFEVR
jgi:hypothetical protein